MCPTGRARPGATLVELLAALTLTGVLGAVLAGLLITQLRMARDVAVRAADAEALRTVRTVLEGEARRMMSEDVRAFAPDSIAVRAFRGSAALCPDAAGLPVVRYRGDRLPDPRKDSVLVVAAAGSRVAALLDSRPGSVNCGGSTEQVLTWRLSAPVDSAAVLLVFESGNYYLSNRALRYRLGAEGRQPLTTEAFVQAGSRFEQLVAGALVPLETGATRRRAVLRLWFGRPVSP